MWGMKRNTRPSKSSNESPAGNGAEVPITHRGPEQTLLEPTYPVLQTVAAHLRQHKLKYAVTADGDMLLFNISGDHLCWTTLVYAPTSYVATSDQVGRQCPGAGAPSDPGEAHATAGAFLASAEAAKEEVFPSVSYGRDHRYAAAGVVGSALVHEGKLIHAAFLRVEGADQGRETSARLASLRRRRRFRE